MSTYHALSTIIYHTLFLIILARRAKLTVERLSPKHLALGCTLATKNVLALPPSESYTHQYNNQLYTSRDLSKNRLGIKTEKYYLCEPKFGTSTAMRNNKSLYYESVIMDTFQ